MKFTIDELLAKFPLPANGKWKESVFDVETFKKRWCLTIYAVQIYRSQNADKY